MIVRNIIIAIRKKLCTGIKKHGTKARNRSFFEGKYVIEEIENSISSMKELALKILCNYIFAIQHLSADTHKNTLVEIKMNLFPSFAFIANNAILNSDNRKKMSIKMKQ